jgi:hypothetical protein
MQQHTITASVSQLNRRIDQCPPPPPTPHHANPPPPSSHIAVPGTQGLLQLEYPGSGPNLDAGSQTRRDLQAGGGEQRAAPRERTPAAVKWRASRRAHSSSLQLRHEQPNCVWLFGFVEREPTRKAVSRYHNQHTLFSRPRPNGRTARWPVSFPADDKRRPKEPPNTGRAACNRARPIRAYGTCMACIRACVPAARGQGHAPA